MAEIKLTLDLKFSRRFVAVLGAAAVIFCVVPGLDSESVTLSTYYPAPSGIYTQLITTGNTWLGRNGGLVWVGKNTPLGPSVGTRMTVMNGNVGISTGTATAKLSFNDLNDGTTVAAGITWYNPSPTTYGIHRTAGAWSAPDYQQLRFGWDTGVIIDGGNAYGKSGTVFQPANAAQLTGGYVGIGITNPKMSADVNGEVIVRNTGLADALQFTKP
jgi:hypothetical protein